MSCRHLLCCLFLFSTWGVKHSAHAQIVAPKDFLVLTNAAQIRALTQAEAAKQLPIRLRGVIIAKDHDGAFTLIDDSVGMYVWDPENIARAISRGDWVELEGVTDPGKFAPHVDARGVRKLGAGAVPPPQLADPDDLFNGRLDAQWIEVSGIVRQVKPVWGGLDLEISVVPGGGRILAHATGFGLTAAVDSTVRLRAVCYYQFNNARQMLGPYLSIPQGESIGIIKPSVTNLDALPERSVESLMQFSVAQDGIHRVRVRGVVTYSQPNEGIWLRDAQQHGLRVLCEVNEPLPVGTEMDVFGFLKRGEYGPLLEDAIIRRTGKILSTSPTVLTNAAEALEHDADLIGCEAVIQEQWRALDDIRLKLRAGATDFQAVLRLNGDQEPLLRLVPGTRVRVTGVCTVGFRVEATTPGVLEPQFFQILLRSPTDVQVLQLPSWWTAEHVGWLTAGMMGFLLAIAGGIFWVHRRRMARQMAVIKAQAALAAERARIARDLHDEIGANLTHISILSTLASQSVSEQPQSARQQSAEAANAAQQTIRAFDEILWSVNPKNDTLHSTSHYVCRYAEETLAPSGIAYRFELDESFPNLLLPPNRRHGLLLAVKEVLHNVIKHAGARRVEIKCGMETDRVFIVQITDDGCGIGSQADAVNLAKREGQGLENLRRRLAELGGTCMIESQLGHGTKVALRLPL